MTDETGDPHAVVDGCGTLKVFEIYIKTTPELLWDAITDPDLRARYQFGVRFESDWAEGSEFRAAAGDFPIADGEILEADPPRRLVQSYRSLWSDEVKAAGHTRVTWEIEQVGSDSCRLRVRHDQLADDANSELFGGWPMVLSGLKTLLETGEDLTTPGSLMYAGTAD